MNVIRLDPSHLGQDFAQNLSFPTSSYAIGQAHLATSVPSHIKESELRMMCCRLALLETRKKRQKAICFVLHMLDPSACLTSAIPLENDASNRYCSRRDCASQTRSEIETSSVDVLEYVTPHTCERGNLGTSGFAIV